MDSEKQYPLKLQPNTVMRYCCFFFLVSSLILLSSSILLILLVLKPKKPIFHLSAVHLDHIKLDSSSEKGVILQPSTASLQFLTQNFNKFGIRYSATNFGLIYESNLVGIINVPGFYQPPNSTNVTVIMHVLLERVNISRFMNAKIEHNGGNASNGTRIEIQTVGIVRAGLHAINFSLPMLKVCVDCRIELDYGAEELSKGVMFIKAHKALVLSKFSHFEQKCSVDLCL